MTRLNVDLCAPEIFGGYGGIQTYMRLLLRALARHDHLGRIFSLNDTADDADDSELYAQLDTPFFGAEGSKLQLILDLALHCDREAFLLHGHVNQSPVGRALKQAGRISGYGIILHGVEAWKRLSWPKRLALAGADLVVSTTPYTRSEVEKQNGVSPDRHEILPLAVEPDRFSKADLEPRDDESDAPLRVLTVARLADAERYKGVDHVLAAVAESESRGVPVEYRIVGDGDDRSRLEHMADALAVDDRVEFLGNVSDAELDACFRWADVFAMPSAGEGFGLVYLEAMHHGLPVIASPEGGPQYVIDDGTNGLMTEYGDVAEIADALARLDDPETWQRLSRGAREAVQTTYAFRRFADQLDAILETPAN